MRSCISVRGCVCPSCLHQEQQESVFLKQIGARSGILGSLVISSHLYETVYPSVVCHDNRRFPETRNVNVYDRNSFAKILGHHEYAVVAVVLILRRYVVLLNQV